VFAPARRLVRRSSRDRGRIATAAGKTLVAIKAIALRFNAISEELSIAHEKHAPIFE
jgi:superfamily II DNA or RNA helicase